MMTISISFADRSLAGEQCFALFSKEEIPVTPALNVSQSRAETLSAITAAESLVTRALQSKLIKTSEAKHLREDLEALKKSPNPKEGQETYRVLLADWNAFSRDIEAKINQFEKLPRAEQKKLKPKIELPIYFATAHFIVFLETNNQAFNYARMSNILTAVNGRSNKEDLMVYLYVFEREMKRFFSAREFRRCRA